METGTDGRSVNRSKMTEVVPLGNDRFRFTSRLTDTAIGGDFEGDRTTIHDFELVGEVEGPGLTLLSLTVQAYAHPFGECPFVIPATERLVGNDLMSGWRRTVLGQLGGTHGCTHVNTLLLGLSEMQTMVFFFRMNDKVPYTRSARENGDWMRQGLQVEPALAGVCHGLRKDGQALAGLLAEMEGQD